jgi:chromosome segregation ATPase
LLLSYDICIPIPRKIVFQRCFSAMIRLKLPSSILNTMAPLDPPDPSTNKSSLLWAYHLRQENIHLVGRIDSIGSELVSANEKTLGVQQSFSALETRLKILEAEKQAENQELRHEMRSLMRNLSGAIEDATLQIRAIRDEMMGLRTTVESAILRVKEIEEDAAELRAGLCNVEDKCALVQKHVEVSLSEVAREMHTLQRDTGGRLSQVQAAMSTYTSAQQHIACALGAILRSLSL